MPVPEFALLLLVLMVGSSEQLPWTPDTYPDPRNDPRYCNRPGPGPFGQFICDVDGMMSEADRNAAQSYLKEIFQSTNPFPATRCGGRVVSNAVYG